MDGDHAHAVQTVAPAERCRALRTAASRSAGRDHRDHRLKRRRGEEPLGPCTAWSDAMIIQVRTWAQARLVGSFRLV